MRVSVIIKLSIMPDGGVTGVGGGIGIGIGSSSFVHEIHITTMTNAIALILLRNV
jgi:hypothetical protein